MPAKTYGSNEHSRCEHEQRHPQELGAGAAREVLALLAHAKNLLNSLPDGKRVFLYFYLVPRATRVVPNWEHLAQLGTLAA